MFKRLAAACWHWVRGTVKGRARVYVIPPIAPDPRMISLENRLRPLERMYFWWQGIARSGGDFGTWSRQYVEETSPLKRLAGLAPEDYVRSLENRTTELSRGLHDLHLEGIEDYEERSASYYAERFTAHAGDFVRLGDNADLQMRLQNLEDAIAMLEIQLSDANFDALEECAWRVRARLAAR